MTLDELKKLDASAVSLELRARERREAAAWLCKVRRDDTVPLGEVVNGAMKAWVAWHSIAAGAVRRAEAVVRDEVLRIAELDLEAEARRLTAEARARRAAISIYLEEPATSPVGEKGESQ